MKVWNWEGFWSYFTNLYLLEGALWTIGLTISTLILGGLIGLGVPDVHVKAYDKAVGNSSGMLLAVEVSDTTKAQVKDILKATGGKSISTE